MLWIIARKELLDIVRDGRFRVGAGVVLALTLASLAAGWKHYADLSAQHREAAQATRAQWLGQPKKSPHSAAHYGVYTFKPKSQLGIVDTGVDPYVGVAAWLEAHKQNEFRYLPAQDRPALQRFGELTAAEVLQVLLPLFVILMTFQAFGGERESGTLRQLLSLGVTRSQLLAGKALGIVGALAIILLPAVVVGVAALALTSDTGVLAGSSSRGVFTVLAYVLYLGVFVALALATSAWLPSSRLALIALLAFWMFNSLVLPRLAADIAGRVHPLPSAVEFTSALTRDLNDTREVESRIAIRRAALLKQFNVETTGALPIGFSGVSLQEGEEHGNEVFDRHYRAIFDVYERQNRLSMRASLTAPLPAIRSLSMALAGTDFDQHRHFVTAAEEYRRLIQRVMNGDIVTNQKPGSVYLAGTDLWGQVPAFEYSTPGTWSVVRRQSAAILLLLGWTIGAGLLAVVAFRRAAVL